MSKKNHIISFSSYDVSIAKILIYFSGRVHISIKFDRNFIDILRFDYALDFFAVISLIFLQALAVILGYKMEQEQERRNSLTADQSTRMEDEDQYE